ncbi:MAG: GNAT family N-acetyltransferase [Bacteroidota bacterium]
MIALVKKADTADLQKKAFRIREEVFVKEQKVDAQDEFDEFEATSHHFVALNKTGDPIGSARWRITSKGIKLERFTVKKALRGKGIGSDLVQAVLEDIQGIHGADQYLYLHAQLTAVDLYLKFGFKKEGNQFDECGIMHYLMWRKS